MGGARVHFGLLVALSVLLGVLGAPRAAVAAGSGGTTQPGGSGGTTQPGAPDIDAVARANRLSVGQAGTVLAETSAKVGSGDRIYFDDPLPDESKLARAARQVAPRTAVDPTRTFVLHSRPGSNRVIYLDFDGHTLTGTAWNDKAGISTIAAPPFSLDGSVSFSDLEHEIIQSAWQRVAEDFSPFDVDVTTQDPGEAAITRSGVADLRFGTRALVTNTNGVGDQCGCAGRAFLDVFDDPTDHARFQPALVFGHPLGGDAQSIADAVSHEVGHNLSLSHDGSGTGSYYFGHGSWTPLMGSGWNPITQWSKGEYAGATNTEDDLQLMQDSGLPLFPDDHSDVSATATALSGPSASVAGLISTDADVDVFRVQAPEGMATFTAAPASNSPNLDVRLELRSATGTLLAADDPMSHNVDWERAGGLDASITFPVTVAGDYFLHVAGVGTGDPITGYSGYGSLGIYVLEAKMRKPAVSVVSSLNPSPLGQSVTFTASITVPPPGSGTPTGTVTFNDGARAVCRIVPIIGGQAACTTSAVGAGSRSVTALYSGDSSFSPVASATLTQVVDGDDVSLTLTSSSGATSNGDVVTLRATVSATAGVPTGSVSFADGDNALCTGIPVSNGEATCTWRMWRGDHPLTATYLGDDRFDRTTSAILTHVTTGIATTLALTSSSNPSVTNEQIVLRAKVTPEAPAIGNSLTGTVTFRHGSNVLCTSPVATYDDNRSYCQPRLPIGTYVITAEYSGDVERHPSTSSSVTQTVTQGLAAIDLTVSPSPSSSGQWVMIIAKVDRKAPAGGWPTGTITITANGTVLCAPLPISSGQTACSRPLDQGSHAVVAHYSGDAAFAAGSIETLHAVGPPAAAVTVASSANPVARGATVTFTADVWAAVGGTGTPTGTVAFLDGDTVLCDAVPISSDLAKCTVVLGAGTRRIRAVYGGDATFVPGSSEVLDQKVIGDGATVTLMPSLENPVSGQSLTFHATVDASGAGLPTPTGALTFRGGTTPLCTGIPIVAGAAACAAALRTGTHAVTVEYTGDDRFNAATSPPLNQAVTRARASALVTSSTNPSPLVPAAALTATVAVTEPGNAQPTGTVTFKEGETVLCASVVVVAAAAACTPSLSGGTHWITAAYSGDGDVEGASSPVYEQFVQPVGDGLTAITPKRLLDSRSGLGTPGGAFGPGSTRTLQVRGGATGIPATATAIVLNVTATAPSAMSFLTVHPSSTARPGTSNLTFTVGQTIANLVTVAVGEDGGVAIFNAHGSVHVIADAVGYYSRPGGSTSSSIKATRLLDTRVGKGGPAAPIGPGATRELTVRGGTTGIPETATAILVNMTVTAPTAPGYLTVHPAGVPRPTASNLNFASGQTVANLTLVGIGTGGRISIFNPVGSAHVLADVVGYHIPSGGSSFRMLPPQRILDTRLLTGAPVIGGSARAVFVYDMVALPPSTVVLLNVTAVTPSAPGFITVNPDSWTSPSTSNLNFSTGQVISNLVVADLNFWDRMITIYTTATTHLVVDIVGYTNTF